MFSRTLVLSSVAAAGLALGGTGRAQAQGASRSPFLPPQAANSPTPSAGAPLVFAGTMETPEGGKQVRIFDPARKTGAWLKVGERDANLDVLVKQIDEDRDTVTIEHEGKPLTLAERVPKVASSGIAQPMAPPMPAPVAPSPMPAAITNTVAVNPTPAQEQARLEAVAAEVARRRALREQAQQQVNQGQPPQVGVPQPNQNLQPNSAIQQRGLRGRGAQPQK